MIPLSVVMDERICTGHEYALFWASVRRYLKHPELLEGKFDQQPQAAKRGICALRRFLFLCIEERTEKLP